MKIAIGFASSSRRHILTRTVLGLSRQTRLPDQIFISPGQPEDVDEVALRSSDIPVSVLSGPPGLPAQRNTIIEASDADIVIFFDDDFLPAPDFVAQAAQLFAKVPGIVVATGTVIADGILGPGWDHAEGEEILEQATAAITNEFVDVHNAYGCNMIIRMEPVRTHSLRFDENLPLYAWWEDVDFSRQLAPFGRIVRASALRGVHLGFKRSGRTPGRRLGYSQVANRVYLVRKGTVSSRHAWAGILRNLLANFARVFTPEPWVDRRGRLAGNIRALRDLVKGNITPSKILEL